VFLREGRIVERGSHEELMASDDGSYRDLVRAFGDTTVSGAPT
jgi:ABC-type multidrug transport system fused ATPase/permease subunit